MTIFKKTFEELSKDELYEILKAREEIFVLEQKCFYQDIDDIDRKALHIFTKDGEKITSYLREFADEKDPACAHIGRVLARERGKGTGTEIMLCAKQAAKDFFGCKKIEIEAQSHAVRFYEKLGFTVTSEEFLDAGIPHKKMEIRL